MFKALIFDFDGVIVDSEQAHYEACRRVFSEIGLHLSRREYQQKYIGLSDKEMFPKVLEDKGRAVTDETIYGMIIQKINAYRSIITDANQVPVVTGLYAFIDDLVRQQKRIGICSGSSKREVMVTLDKLYQDHLQSCFETIVTANDVSFTKPHPEGYLLAADNLMVDPSYCMVIEDSPVGIEAAKGAGMYVVGLTTTYNAYALKNADLVVSDFDALPRINSFET
ncbi:MAG: HAD family phosphatase [Gammaproteobacteria bacterium]|nr:HAD family phosphatase [Gammaproteobacteria bacterium]